MHTDISGPLNCGIIHVRTLYGVCQMEKGVKGSGVSYATVMTCASRSRSRMWQNPTGDDQVSSVHEHGSRAKVASSTTVLAHWFPCRSCVCTQAKCLV